MNAILGLGRYLFALPMLVFGIFHFMGAKDMAGMVPAYLGGSVIWVYLTGAGLAASAISMLIGKYDKLASMLLALMLVVFVLTIHLPKAMANDMSGTISVLKDLAMAGGALLYAKYIAKDTSIVG